MLAQRLLSDLEADLGRVHCERPFLADSRRWCSGKSNDGWGSKGDSLRSHRKRLELGVERSSEVCFYGAIQFAAETSENGGKAAVLFPHLSTRLRDSLTSFLSH